MSDQEPNQKRKKVPGIYVQLTEEEMKQVENLCISYGEKVQKLFRRLIFGVELPKVVFTQKDRATFSVRSIALVTM